MSLNHVLCIFEVRPRTQYTWVRLKYIDKAKKSLLFSVILVKPSTGSGIGD